MMKKSLVVLVSTFNQVLYVLAGMRSRAIVRDDYERIVLVMSSHATEAEVFDVFPDEEARRLTLAHFDSILSFNDFVAPLHPTQWTPREIDAIMWQRALRVFLGLGGEPVDLVVESIQVNPARALLSIFWDSTFTVIADGVMVYGPTRNMVPVEWKERLTAVVYPELIQGISPQLLDELEAVRIPIPAEPLRDIFSSFEEAASKSVAGVASEGGTSAALVVGQYLSDLGLISIRAELELYKQMVRKASEAGSGTVYFKPHPNHSDNMSDKLMEAAKDLGLSLVVIDSRYPAELLASSLNVGLVVGCFSTALFSSRELLKVHSMSVGTERVLSKLSPYENSNRVPLLLSQFLLDSGVKAPTNESLESAVESVAYTMQPKLLQHKRARVVAILAAAPEIRALVGQRRLTQLGLPGGGPKGALFYKVRTVAKWGERKKQLRRLLEQLGR